MDLLPRNHTDMEAEEHGVSNNGGVGCTSNQVLQPADVAVVVLYAMAAPPHVANINDVLVEPTDQEGHDFVPAFHQFQA